MYGIEFVGAGWPRPYAWHGADASGGQENGFPRRFAPRNDRGLFHCHCDPVYDVAGAAIRDIRASQPQLCLRRLPFFLRRKKGRKERRQNPWFWNPLRGRSAADAAARKPREWGAAKSVPCFRMVSASPSAGRARQGWPLRLPGGGVWAPRPTGTWKGVRWAMAGDRKGRPYGG